VAVGAVVGAVAVVGVVGAVAVVGVVAVATFLVFDLSAVLKSCCSASAAFCLMYAGMRAVETSAAAAKRSTMPNLQRVFLYSHS
jgi:hypothetical protein